MTDDFGELKGRAEQGDPAAQYEIGIRFFIGDGVGQDLKEAYKWIFESAMQDYSDAMYTLGVMYRSGLGVEKSGNNA